MRIIYESNDGTQFSTAEECERYESKSSILLDRKKFLCFDRDFHPIKLDEEYNFTKVIERAYFFICFTQDAVEFFQQKVNESDGSDIFPYIRKNVLYGWEVDNEDCWSDVEEVVEDLETHAAYLREAVSSMNDEIERAKQGK